MNIKVAAYTVTEYSSLITYRPFHKKFIVCDQQKYRPAAYVDSLSNTFLTCCLDSIIGLHAAYTIPQFYLVLLAVEAKFCLKLSQRQKAAFFPQRN